MAGAKMKNMATAMLRLTPRSSRALLALALAASMVLASGVTAAAVRSSAPSSPLVYACVKAGHGAPSLVTGDKSCSAATTKVLLGGGTVVARSTTPVEATLWVGNGNAAVKTTIASITLTVPTGGGLYSLASQIEQDPGWFWYPGDMCEDDDGTEVMIGTDIDGQPLLATWPYGGFAELSGGTHTLSLWLQSGTCVGNIVGAPTSSMLTAPWIVAELLG